MSRRTRQRGFTLLELLITLSVTTIGLVGLLALHVSVARGNDGASRSADAQQIGANELEALRTMRLTDLMFTLTHSYNYNVSFNPPPTRTQTIPGRGGVPYTVITTVNPVTNVSATLLRIRVVTAWTEDGAAKGANGGQTDHALALEVLRTMEESL